MLWDRLRRRHADDGCGCQPTFEDDRLVVEADACDGDGRLAHEPDCRATVIDALVDRDAACVLTRANGVERAYEDAAAGLLLAAGRFVEAAAVHDATLAERARTDPIRAGYDASGRAGPVARVAAETGLAEGARRAAGYDDALRPFVGPTLAHSRVADRPPSDARLRERRDVEGPTETVSRVYDLPGRELALYHVEPAEARLDASATATLAAAYDRLATGGVAGGERAPRRAVATVVDGDDGDDGEPIETLVGVLRKHTRGFGVLADLFADPGCSDVFVTAPAGDRPLRVVVADEAMTTNVRLTARGAETLASRFRRSSGRAFSRATPTLDALADTGGRSVRVAGVTDPVSDGVAFAFRAHDREAWTLPALVANGTLPADAAALLSVAVERVGACLFAGARGAGKTTLLGACCFELPAATRTVVIEDIPELQVDALLGAGRDVQRLAVDRTGDAALAPGDALRTALRLGEGALVVGEVRGEEAATLFEAMRVGANDGAVLGTIHGEGAHTGRERIVDDLGVAPGAMGATDLVVTLGSTPAGRRVTAIEELSTDSAAVGNGADGNSGRNHVAFAGLYDLTATGLEPTGRPARARTPPSPSASTARPMQRSPPSPMAVSTAPSGGRTASTCGRSRASATSTRPTGRTRRRPVRGCATRPTPGSRGPSRGARSGSRRPSPATGGCSSGTNGSSRCGASTGPSGETGIGRASRATSASSGTRSPSQSPASTLRVLASRGTGSRRSTRRAARSTARTSPTSPGGRGTPALPATRSPAAPSAARSQTVPRPSSATRPRGSVTWIRDEVAGLHAHVRAIATTVPRGEVGTYAASPAARLADRLRSRRAALVDAPATYDGVADKARVEARRTYVDAVIAELERRVDAHRGEEGRLEEALGNHGLGSLSRLRDVMAVGANARTSPTSLSTSASRPTDGPLGVTEDTAPSYLTLDEVSYDRIDARGTGTTTPQAARNVNLFSVPYGDVSDTIVGELFGSNRVRLRTAAGTLRAAEAYSTANASFRRDRDRLRDAVAAANDNVRTRLRSRLRHEGIGDTRADRVALVQEGLSRWRTAGARGEALANGSASIRIAAAATGRAGDRAWLAAALNATVDDAVTDVDARIDRSLVNRTADSARAHSRRVTRDVAASVGKSLARNAAEMGAVRLSKGKLSAIPAGLPVAPWPGYWYVTTNVWVVESRGTYERVSVRSRRGLRDTVYTRDGGRGRRR